MRFIKLLIIRYILTCLFGLIITIISLINPYFFISIIFSLLILLFYGLMIINLGFTILYIYLLFTKKESDPIKCYNIGNYGFFCKLCDYYIECKERKINEKKI